jgi:hypothetical protein
VVVVYKIWWAEFGTVSDFATLLRHKTAKCLPTPGVEKDLELTLGFSEFDVHGSVQIGNIRVQFKVQLDVIFMYSLFFFIFSSACFGCYLHSSSGTQLHRTAIGVCVSVKGRGHNTSSIKRCGDIFCKI